MTSFSQEARNTYMQLNYVYYSVPLKILGNYIMLYCVCVVLLLKVNMYLKFNV